MIKKILKFILSGISIIVFMCVITIIVSMKFSGAVVLFWFCVGLMIGNIGTIIEFTNKLDTKPVK